ncbi:MAG: malto-oligosyltrehalose trehalohydrolase [Nitrospira sp.]|nr:malto-oligosyltrehalose trehalohydrolase [bacterium]MBL7049382.1 malto-oligosyltrehalose trehalohydrolase [Nitrospira sp.]
MKIGAYYIDSNICEFRVWAPLVERMELILVSRGGQVRSMRRDSLGYWRASVRNDGSGFDYLFRINALTDRPDPASHMQPDGVHNASRVVAHQSFSWRDEEWKCLSLAQMIMYEIHIGTFTEEGTFDSAITRLDYLQDLGINAIEIMPVAQFPGTRNWGYDGVYPFAVQASYGGPDGLKRFVNECHLRGIAVILDVVYNHLGPEGNYLRDFGPYFTDRYSTPWGEALNFDGEYSNGVRNYFIENALHWFSEYHIDALRLDAIHGIYDVSARHFLRELAERVKEYAKQEGRIHFLIAESDLNDPSVVSDPRNGGFGIDALWCDDFHHALHTVLTGESSGYYRDFDKVENIELSLSEGFVYSGQYSEHRKRNHGASSAGLTPDQFVVFSQNHDQVGNRLNGERLSSLISFEGLKLAAGVVLLSPYIPMLFMGEEYGEEAPFLYFVSHSDQGLNESIKEGRKKEHEAFKWQGEPLDPVSKETFERSVLRWDTMRLDKNAVLLKLYAELIHLRKTLLLTGTEAARRSWSDGKGQLVFLEIIGSAADVIVIMNFSERESLVQSGQMISESREKVFDSSDLKWLGPGSSMPDTFVVEDMRMRPHSIVLYVKDKGATER